jgi:hypothetical protein
MRNFILERSSSEIYTSAAGLALGGLCLNKHTPLAKSLRTIPKRHGIATIDLARTYLGLILTGKSDFEAVDLVRHDPFFKEAMGIKQSPSASRLRQRFDEDAKALIPLLDEASVAFLLSAKAPITALATGHVPLEMDVFPQDNGRTKKEGVSRTYKDKIDGYAPIAAYVGNEGWCVCCELRPGAQHSQKEFGYTLERVLPRVRALTSAPILVRLDSAHDAQDNRDRFRVEEMDYLTKWNPRKQAPLDWYDLAKEQGADWSDPRPGKRVAVFSVTRYDGDKDEEKRPYRLVVRLIIRMSDRHGQLFLEPQFELEGWTTSLAEQDYDNETIIQLYRDHATSEQFHSEFKTDLDLERLPSGKFDTNDLVMAFGVLAYNILRWMGIKALLGKDSPVRHPAKRRRLRTVMQEIIGVAGRMMERGRRLVLRFGNHCPGFNAYGQLHRLLN